MSRTAHSWNDSAPKITYSEPQGNCPEAQVIGDYTLVRDTEDPSQVVQIKNVAYKMFVDGEHARLNA